MLAALLGPAQLFVLLPRRREYLSTILLKSLTEVATEIGPNGHPTYKTEGCHKVSTSSFDSVV